jgi:hypothetical protein
MNKVTLENVPDWADHPSVRRSNSSRLISWLNQKWTALADRLSRSHEPRVWQKQNAAGEVFYHAYDPYSGRSAYLSSDVELRSWLEKLPFQ